MFDSHFTAVHRKNFILYLTFRDYLSASHILPLYIEIGSGQKSVGVAQKILVV